MSTFRDVATVESVAKAGALNVFFFRRGAGEFALSFANAIAKLNIRKIVWMCQSESDGNISCTVFYE